jgi:hypothetical protein
MDFKKLQIIINEELQVVNLLNLSTMLKDTSLTCITNASSLVPLIVYKQSKTEKSGGFASVNSLVLLFI